MSTRPHREPYPLALGLQALGTPGPATFSGTASPTPHSGPSTIPKPAGFLLPPPSLGFSGPQCLLALSLPGLLPVSTAATHQKAEVDGVLTHRGHGFDFKLAPVSALCVKKKKIIIF